MYKAEISERTPSCFLFMIDQSGSMQDPVGGSESDGKNKAKAVADAVNRLLREVVLRCAAAERIKDRFEVGVIGYGSKVGPAFCGDLSGRDLVRLSEVATHPARIDPRTKKVEDGTGGLVEQKVQIPIWFDPVADGGTPMCAALQRTTSILEPWVNAHRASYPPIVINITDGESTDGDPSQAAAALKALATDDGSVLFYNLHLSSTPAPTSLFPDPDQSLPDQFARLLFDMSSPLPQQTRIAASERGYNVTEQARGFVFNGDGVVLVDFLDIGTRPSLR